MTRYFTINHSPPANRWGRTVRWLMAVCAIFTFSGASAQALSGTYTICASGCSYSTIGAARTALQNNGVSGPVVFNVASGNYNESVTFGTISGVSATNTVTFNGTGTSATRIYNSSYPLYFNYTQRVGFQNMTIEHTSSSFGLYIYYAKNLIFDNCVIKSPSASGYPVYSNYATALTFKNCRISGGYYGLYLWDYNNSSAGGHTLENNRITNFYYYGIYNYAYYSLGHNKYLGNYIDSGNSGYTYQYCILSYYENGSTFKNNLFGTSGKVRYGSQIYSPNFSSSSDPVEISNNFFGGEYYGVYLYVSATNVQFLHNTVHCELSAQYPFYCRTTSTASLDVRNNSFSRNSSGYAAYYPSTTGFAYLDGNNYYNTGGNLAYWGGAQATWADFKAAVQTTNPDFEKYGGSMQPVFKSATDFHYDQTTAAPSGRYAGINVDIDGDSRCLLFPTSGADESSFGKAKPVVKIFYATPVYKDAPVTFYNSAKDGEPKVHSWYVDGVLASTQVNFKTSLSGTSHVVKLVSETCAGKDSFTVNVSVSIPTSVPVSDFVSNKNIILQGESVKFTDLSTNGASKWHWEITPVQILDAGSMVPRYIYTEGDTSTELNEVQFIHPGNYQVCLTATNALGAGNKECKVDYIEVQPAINIGSQAVIRDASGNLYDDGGPKGNYNDNSVNKVLIDPCASEVSLVFNKFTLECDWDFIRIYDGKDETGIPLHTCTTNMGLGGEGPGFTGPGCTNACVPGTDTFVAKSGKMFIVMVADAYVNEAGFDASWWSTPKTYQPPVASFDAVDSVCTQSFVDFTNTSTGEDADYFWDLDGDLSTFEITGSTDFQYPFFVSGTQTVTLISINCGGIDTFSRDIEVYDPPIPTFDFIADNTAPTTNDIVYLTVDAEGCIDDHEWKFTHSSGQVKYMNGTSQFSENIAVNLPAKGCWDVQLKIGNTSGEDSLYKSCYITVKDAYCIPSVSIMVPDIGISNVIFGDISNSSAQGVKEYSNFVPTNSSVANIGATYELTVERTTAKNKMTRTVWIDWNA
ncbi:MAG: right-handed parallel beta-helix repeat-containing protein, partial [Bacteroidota bacterium]|nr:right-handed parallel beta-helix repeat-containing protein [Bacteroidota bacterium]